jgi:hypothetical protein
MATVRTYEIGATLRKFGIGYKNVVWEEILEKCANKKLQPVINYRPKPVPSTPFLAMVYYEYRISSGIRRGWFPNTASEKRGIALFLGP